MPTSGYRVQNIHRLDINSPNMTINLKKEKYGGDDRPTIPTMFSCHFQSLIYIVNHKI